jgi:hypothetical protein
LLEAGCSKIQGYLISRPLSLSDVVNDVGTEQHPVPMAIGLVHLATIDHINWRKNMISYALRNALLGPADPDRQLPSHPTLSCRECAVGRWYLNDQRTFSVLPAFGDLHVLHLMLHATGMDIVRHIQGGAMTDQIGHLVDELNNRSIRLLDCLTRLETEGMAMIYRSPNP